MTQGASNWYAPSRVDYYKSSANAYNGTLYRRNWSADDGYYYTPYTGATLYTGYTASRLVFADESDNGHTLQDSTAISISGGSSTATQETKTFLVEQGG